jgi:hypothetical protein
MPHTRFLRRAALAGLVCLSLALSAGAGSLPADALPLPNRVAHADAVVVGKVTAIEEKTVMAPAFAGAKDKVEYTIAVITVGDALPAPEGAKKIRLGFVPTPPGVVINPRPYEPVVGQEGCFFLTKHPDGGFYVAPGPLVYLDGKSPTFEKDVALVKRCVLILRNPNVALQDANAETRFLAAAMLLTRYTTRRSPNPKTEPIDAEQSKRILLGLATADWTPTTDLMQMSPYMVFHRLALTEKDGWTPPSTPFRQVYSAYAQQWLKDHAVTYRIQRFVP